MAAVVFPSPSPSPFPFPLPSPIMLLCRCSVFLSEFVASLRHLLYEQLFACHWISPSPCSPSLPPCPATAPLLIFDMTNVRRLIRPQTTRSSPKPANLLRCSALHCALCQSKPCINYTKRRLFRPATPPASHLPHARLVHCCSRIELDQSMLSWGPKLIRLTLSLSGIA